MLSRQARMNPHLGVCVHCIEMCSCHGVPKSNAPVGRPSTGRQQVALEGAPSNRLHRCLVGSETVERVATAGRPHMEQIIVASTCKLLSAWRPFKPTNFLLMTPQLCCHMLSLPSQKCTGLGTDTSWYTRWSGSAVLSMLRRKKIYQPEPQLSQALVWLERHPLKVFGLTIHKTSIMHAYCH